ncbi:MAG: hypothetical protein KatS3mg101_1109 [Patescibacteria group bacterium]|nr:MAG: hypothetical protein KatS3mg101_1109 [Patescibacteria group bacterium]
MLKNYKNKQITDEAVVKTSEEEQEYHFSGGGEYEPMTIKAHSYEEALAKWEQIRKKVEQKINN